MLQELGKVKEVVQGESWGFATLPPGDTIKDEGLTCKRSPYEDFSTVSKREEDASIDEPSIVVAIQAFPEPGKIASADGLANWHKL